MPLRFAPADLIAIFPVKPSFEEAVVSSLQQLQRQRFPNRGFFTFLDYTSTITKEFTGLDFDNAHPASYDERLIEVYKTKYSNGSRLEQSVTLGEDRTTQASNQVIVTNGIRTKMGASFHVGFGNFGGASVDLSTEVDFTTQTQQAHVYTQRWNCSTPLRIAPGTTVSFICNVISARYKVDFKGVVLFSGEVHYGDHDWFAIAELGELFRAYPTPEFGARVLDNRTIAVDVAGYINTVMGINLNFDITETNVNGDGNRRMFSLYSTRDVARAAVGGR